MPDREKAVDEMEEMLERWLAAGGSERAFWAMLDRIAMSVIVEIQVQQLTRTFD